MFGLFGNKEEKEERSMGASNISLWNWVNGESKVNSVLSVNTGYSCIRLISNTLSSTPIKYYKETEKGNEELKNNHLTKLMRKPFKNMTYFQWLNVMTTNFNTNGNAYAYIVRQGNRPVELIPLTDELVSLQETTQESEPYYYRITLPNSKRQVEVFPEDMVHMRNITLDGIMGLSPLTYNRLVLEGAKSQLEYQKNFIENSANVSGIIESEKKLSKDMVEELRKNFSSKFSGMENAGKTPVLPEGLKYKQVNIMSPLDTDYINTKKLTEEDVCKIFGVPLSMLGSANSTYSNAEQDSIKFQRYTMQPIQDMLAQELSLKLINPFNQNDTFFEFSPDLIKLTSSKERAETISLLKRDGIITPNEAREYYNKTAKENGDELVIQINTAPQNLVEEKMELENEAVTKSNNEPSVTESNNVTNSNNEENEDRSIEIAKLEKKIHKLSSDLGRLTKLIK